MTPTQTMRDQCEVVLTRISLQLVIVRKPLPGTIDLNNVGFLIVLHARSPSSFSLDIRSLSVDVKFLYQVPVDNLRICRCCVLELIRKKV